MLTWVSSYLQTYHTGSGNAISGPELITEINREARRTVFPTLRDLQSQVESERLEGHPICSAPGVGYWWPVNLADAEHCLRWLKGQAGKHYRLVDVIEDALTVDGQAAMF